MYRQKISKKTSPLVNSTPITNAVPTSSYGSLSSIVQRAKQDVNSISGNERQQLESAIGTKATGEVLTGKQSVPEFKGVSGQLWGTVPVQAKLTIGEVGDKYEQEADRVAASVVEEINRPAPVSDVQSEVTQGKEEGLRMKPILQRREAIGGGEASAELSGEINRARGGGEPLEGGLQQSMGQAMGADFSGVRVHTDGHADRLNQALSSRAFTTGKDLFFKKGEYQPGSREGQGLIAHELTHVEQQNGSTVQHHYIQRRDDIVEVEDESKMESLYKRIYKRSGSRNIYLTDEDGNLERKNNGNLKTKKLVGGNKLQVIKNVVINNVTNPTDLPIGDYFLIKFMEIEVDQNEADTLNLNWVYGYAKQSEVKALGEYQDITAIGPDPTNPKQGKILPEQPNDPAISQTDVYQAAISDCYLHAALVAIVNANPELITALFLIRSNDLDITFPGYNRYGSSFNYTGSLKVTMNKKLFLTPEGEPLYGGKKDSYLWAAFIQKAWAVYKGKYSNLPMGSPSEITGMITGQDGKFNLIAHSQDKEADKAWEVYTNITQALANNKPITIGTERWTDVKSKFFFLSQRVMPSKSDHEGLGIAHAYTILDISDKTQQRPQDESALPTNVTLTLRDPRTKSGDTFELSLTSLLDARKVSNVFIGG